MQLHQNLSFFPWHKLDICFLRKDVWVQVEFLVKLKKNGDKEHSDTISYSKEPLVQWKRDTRHCISYPSDKQANSCGLDAMKQQHTTLLGLLSLHAFLYEAF